MFQVESRRKSYFGGCINYSRDGSKMCFIQNASQSQQLTVLEVPCHLK